MKPIASNGRNQTLGPHPEEAAHRSRACPTSATLKCRNRQQPISMRGRLEGWPRARFSPVAVLRDARILQQAQERAPQDEADGRYRDMIRTMETCIKRRDSRAAYLDWRPIPLGQSLRPHGHAP